MNYKNSIIGSTVAFIVATSCCWLPALIIAVGGGSTILGISNGLERFRSVFLLLGVGLLIFGIYQYRTRVGGSLNNEAILNSIITCPECGNKKNEKMPIDACQYFYECENCKTILRPINNDCCVYCSYGTVACPPIQLNQNCC